MEAYPLSRLDEVCAHFMRNMILKSVVVLTQQIIWWIYLPYLLTANDDIHSLLVN